MATKAKRKAARERRRKVAAGGEAAEPGTRAGTGGAAVDAGGAPVGAGVAVADGGHAVGDRARPKARASRGGPGKAQRKGSSSGRVTARQPRNERYTPPTSKAARKSPPWMGVLIIALFVLGVLLIILNYADVLPGGVDNWWLVGAIGSIFGGLMLATRYR